VRNADKVKAEEVARILIELGFSAVAISWHGSAFNQGGKWWLRPSSKL
jgi:hypothetical protein